MSRIRLLLCASLLSSALACGAVAAGTAQASAGQKLFFEAPSELLNPTTRPHALVQLQALGVKALRVELNWYSVAPAATSATKPSFEATNPASYSWGQYDLLIAEAQRLKWQILLTVTSPVPRWATTNHKAPYITRPSDADFKQFMTAVASHYRKEVSYFSIWNEPNEPPYLLPQFNSNGTPASPRIYRGLFEYGYEGLKAGGIAHPKVLMGETAPVGYANLRREKVRGLLRPVAPLAFLRGTLCLNSHYRRSSSCSLLPAYGYAHHPYSKAVGPTYRPPGADNVTIGVLSRLSRALDRASRAGAIHAGLPIYLTEFGVESYPSRQNGVAPAVQAEYDAIAEHIAYSNQRVASFSQYLLEDDRVGGHYSTQALGGFVGFQTGLEYVSGKPKPLYHGFPVPLSVAKHGRSVSLWGLVRPSTRATKVTVLVKLKGARSYRTLKSVSTNGAGYWTFSSSTRGVDWRVRWISPAGVKYEGPPIRAR